MPPTRNSRGSAKKGSKGGSKFAKGRTPIARPGGLSRELAGLAPWSYWKVSESESESSDEDEDEVETEVEVEEDDEGYESDSLSISESEQDVTEAPNETEGTDNQLNLESETAHIVPGRTDNTSGNTAVQFIFQNAEDAELAITLNIDLEKIYGDRQWTDDTITVSSQSEATSSASVQSLDSSPIGPVESEADRIALAGPKCPLCICPINGVYFATIQCEDCDRTYHQECIGYERCEEYHPFHGRSIPGAKWCGGCGCPDGDVFGVYVGHPSIMFHRRDQDPGFKEYFRQGRLEEAKWEDIE